MNAGTAAIHMACRAAGVGSGDIVFCQSMTFSASANPIVYQNGIPVFIDSEPDTWNMSPEALERAFKKYPHPKAVIVVHLYGTPARLDEIVRMIQTTLLSLPKDVAGDVVRNGITITGGYSKMVGLEKYLRTELKINVLISDNSSEACQNGLIKLVNNANILDLVVQN